MPAGSAVIEREYLAPTVIKKFNGFKHSTNN
jgi:hypothetical protein